ncbi:hypothetical protein ABZ826_26490 [Streptomyces sp. NPDC047515]|uniref:hypothetical protein n=1 Tax=Streptomyces sp. NPDC047515 TaxID=3155380 RepID=UPI0033F9491C
MTQREMPGREGPRRRRTGGSGPALVRKPGSAVNREIIQAAAKNSGLPADMVAGIA